MKSTSAPHSIRTLSTTVKALSYWGVGVDPNAGQEIPGGGFDLMYVLALVDPYNPIKKYHNAVTTVRRGSRWQGSQSYWDAYEDDREFDIVVENGAWRIDAR